MVIDWSRIESLVDMNDPEDLVWLKEMIVSLNENMPVRIQSLREKMEKKDQKELQSELHQIKGVAANFGLALLSQIVIKAEADAKAGNLDLSISESEKIPDAWEKTKAELDARFSS